MIRMNKDEIEERLTKAEELLNEKLEKNEFTIAKF